MKNTLTLIILCTALFTTYAADTWTQLGNITLARSGAIGFSIASKGYMGLGRLSSGPETNDFWQYNPIADSWTQMATFGGSARELAVGFAIGTKGYVGTGGYTTKDFWEYTPSPTNAWVKRADFPGFGRNQATGFAIGSKGYIGIGADSYQYPDFWEYNPSNDSWTQKDNFANLPNNVYNAIPALTTHDGLRGASSFVIGSFAYVGAGVRGSGAVKAFWKFDPTAATGSQWTAIASCQIEHFSGFSFTIDDKGYTGLGAHANATLEVYDPGKNSWSYKTSFIGTSPRYQLASFLINTDCYVVGGDNGAKLNEVWVYSTANAPVLPVELTTINATADVPHEHVDVNWQTATEKQSAYFVIERQNKSTNQFEEIGRVKGAGNSTKTLTYKYIDEKPIYGISYYRLRLADIDGKTTYSKTVSVSYKGGAKVKVFPTFTEGYVNIENGDKRIDDVYVWNASGQLMLQSKQTQLDLSDLPRGLYLVQVKTGGETFVQKITKR